MPVHMVSRGTTSSGAHAVYDGLEDFSGVIHIHTAPYSSDASGTLKGAIRVAQAQELDYLLITEHNTLRGHETGRGGRHGRTLVMIGEEISTEDGHYLALNVGHHVSRYQSTRKILEEIARQGGMGFVPHPFWQKKRWERWDAPEIVGMEIYNVAHDAMEENRTRLLLWGLLLPNEAAYRSVIDRPYDALRLWDALTQHRRFVGIGGADAHEIRWLWITIGTYEVIFPIVRTHLLATELSESALYGALREGHAYIALESDQRADGFTLSLEHGGTTVAIQGDERLWEPELELIVRVPETARIMLLRDGHVIETREATELRHTPTAPGVYRVEVERRNRPWIFSNPIYLRATPPPSAAPDEKSRRRTRHRELPS